MIFGFFARRPLLDEATAQWLFDLFAWALRNFGADVFHRHTILVTPTDAHFPGRVDSVHGMARLICERVQDYAGLGHWPCRLVAPTDFNPAAPVRVALAGPLRVGAGAVAQRADAASTLALTYDPDLINDPEALIATFAQSFGHFLGAMAAQEPPAGRENWPHVTEVLGVFMGFGIMLANSAFQVKARSCGSCCGPAAGRASALSQYDVTYALAIFCVLKGIPAKAVSAHLKASLRPFLRKALKEVAGRTEELARLRAIGDPAIAVASA